MEITKRQQQEHEHLIQFLGALADAFKAEGHTGVSISIMSCTMPYIEAFYRKELRTITPKELAQNLAKKIAEQDLKKD